MEVQVHIDRTETFTSGIDEAQMRTRIDFSRLRSSDAITLAVERVVDGLISAEKTIVESKTCIVHLRGRVLWPLSATESKLNGQSHTVESSAVYYKVNIRCGLSILSSLL